MVRGQSLRGPVGRQSESPGRHPGLVSAPRSRKLTSWFAARFCSQPRAWSRTSRLQGHGTVVRGRWQVRSPGPGLTTGSALAHRPGGTTPWLKVPGGGVAVAITPGKRPLCTRVQSQGTVRVGHRLWCLRELASARPRRKGVSRGGRSVRRAGLCTDSDTLQTGGSVSSVVSLTPTTLQLRAKCARWNLPMPKPEGWLKSSRRPTEGCPSSAARRWGPCLLRGCCLFLCPLVSQGNPRCTFC